MSESFSGISNGTKVKIEKRDKRLKKQEHKLQNKKKSVIERNLEAQIFGDIDTNASFLDPLVNENRTPEWLLSKASNTKKKTKKTIKLEQEKEQLKAEIDEVFENEDDNEMKPAWQDEDDHMEETVSLNKSVRSRKLKKERGEDKITVEDYEKRLRDHFVSTTTDASWAELPSQSNTTEADAVVSKMLSSSENLTFQGRGRAYRSFNDLPELPSGQIDIQRMPDANIDSRSMHSITSIRFHPNGELFMASGMDKTIRIFHLDCERNPKVQSVVLPGFPILCSRFLNDGKEVMATGRRKHFYSYDLVKGVVDKIPNIYGRDDKAYEQFEVSPDGKTLALVGTDGYILFLNSKTKQLIGTCRAPSAIKNIVFSPCNTYVYALTHNGKINTFDVRTRTCVDKFNDEGCIHGTSLAIAPNNQYLATGSDSGVCNVYDTTFATATTSTSSSNDYYDYYGGYDQDTIMNQKKPLKALLNLTTSVTSARFSPSSDILAFSSVAKKDQLKLVHVPTMTVFANWPTATAPLGYVNDVDFSPDNSLFASANEKGKVLLYRLNHYHAGSSK